MQIDPSKQFGQRLKEIRNEKGLSQEQLSFKANIDRSYISDVERGARNISIENISQLASALEIPVYQFFLPHKNILEKWDISIQEMEELIVKNPSLRGFIIGYLAEEKVRAHLAKDRRVTDLKKYDDHDRSNKHDLEITYRGHRFSIETKSLQTSSVKQSKKPGIEFEGTLQCDASDRRKITLNNGMSVETTCLTFGDFDILAVNLYAFTSKWDFAFAHNKDLPSSNYKKYPPEIRSVLIKSLIPITWKLQPPFVSDVFSLLDQLVLERERS